MKLSILLRTIDFRGDHAAEVAEAHTLRDGETLEDLADRLLQDESYIHAKHKVIEIRRIES